MERDERNRVIVPPRDPLARRRYLRPYVMQMVRDLSHDHGKSFATEAGYRRELYRRIGYTCGERSIGRVIACEVRRGNLAKETVRPFSPRVDGEDRHPGTTHVWIPELLTRAKERRRRRVEREKRGREAARSERREWTEKREQETVAASGFRWVDGAFVRVGKREPAPPRTVDELELAPMPARVRTLIAQDFRLTPYEPPADQAPGAPLDSLERVRARACEEQQRLAAWALTNELDDEPPE